jgi:phage terminase large subunit
MTSADLSRIYKPRTVFVDYHARAVRRAVIVAHRRCGKTRATITDMVVKALLTAKPQAHYAYICPFYAQAKQNVWEYLVELALAIPGAQINKSETKVTFKKANGDFAWIRLYGADNPDAIRGTYFDGAILDEFGDMKPDTYTKVVRACLADRKGWVTFIGTPKGKNKFFQMLQLAQKKPETWYSAVLKASETKILDEEELADIRAEIDTDEYNQEYECSFDAAITGSYWGKELNEAEAAGKVGLFPLAKQVPVHLIFDLGFGDAMAVWGLQVIGDQPRVVYNQEWNRVSFKHTFDEIKKLGFKIGDVWLPHDAKQGSWQTGLAGVETIRRECGINPKPIPELDKWDGIQAARQAIPFLVWNKETTEDGFLALKAYQKEFNQKTQTFSRTPRHDWASHSADAFRYLCLVLRKYVKTLVLPEISGGKTVEKEEAIINTFIDVSTISGVTEEELRKLDEHYALIEEFEEY